MSINRFGGNCSRCGRWVEEGQGDLTRVEDHWQLACGNKDLCEKEAKARETEESNRILTECAFCHEESFGRVACPKCLTTTGPWGSLTY